MPHKHTNRKKLKAEIPRVVTIGRRQIIRAYVEGKETAQKRIEIYGGMTLKSLIQLGAKVKAAKAVKAA